MTEPVSPSQQTQNIADGLKIAFKSVVDAIEADDHAYRKLPILAASINLATGRLREMQERLDATERYLESRRHHDRSCSLEAQSYDQLECAEIGTADSLSSHALCILRGQIQT